MSVFTALNNTCTKSKENLTLHHMRKIFISKFTKIKFKIWRVTFLKKIYCLKILGWTSGFRTIDDLLDETEFSPPGKKELNRFCHDVVI